ncbi:MAG: ISNCY family transposase [Clostridiales Family XIII bacterium]|jgi:transposase|nr:ISNCY family transposase [Clostridiales Family XIII bacterium]
MNEQQIYEVIKALVENGGNKKRAELTLNCSRRTIDRYIAGYKALGKVYFVHGNRGRQPAHTLTENKRADIIDLYRNKYSDANFAHFTELLEERENISVSESAVRNILYSADIMSPKANRKTRRRLKEQLRKKLAVSKSVKEAEEIKLKLIDIEDAHPRRSRCSKFGEMIQMDASLHLWVGDHKWTLHLAIDDATGMIVGAWFDKQETLNGYYNVLRQILVEHGIPYMFYTDRRTVFEYRKRGIIDTAKDSFTQFGYACKQLGIQIKTTSVAQAKGRIERLNQTMQSRLPIELRLEGVNTIKQANEYLPGFIAKYNARFAIKGNSIPSVFENQPSKEEIDLTLAVIDERTVDNGHSIRFENKYYRTLDDQGKAVYYYKGTKGLVIRTFSGALFFSVADRVLALDEIPIHEQTSKNFDFHVPEVKAKKRYIPPASHPWRLASFSAFVKKQVSPSA